MTDKHLFAIYLSSKLSHLPEVSVGQDLIIQDKDLVHRVTNVLHLKTGEELILFDGTIQAHVLLAGVKKSSIIFEVLALSAIKPLSPVINLYQGLLKKDSFEDILYYASQMGVNMITPLITKKVHRAWSGQKELERAEKIMIAGCEQSKQYILPKLNMPLDLLKLKDIFTPEDTVFYTDPAGDKLFGLLANLVQKPSQTVHVIIGPEGGFTQEEYMLLKQMGAGCYALTPSILRSQEAVCVTLGALRSVA